MKRTCEETSRSIQSVLDGGEAMPDWAALHLDDCPHCRRLFDRNRLPLTRDSFEVLSPRGRQRIVSGLSRARAGRSFRFPLAAAAALVILATGVVAGLLIRAHDRSGQNSAVEALFVEDHLRYLNNPDRYSHQSRLVLEHDLEAHVDFPVHLPEFSGSQLTGARRCYLAGRRVALAFYDTPEGKVSYFVMSDGGLARESELCAPTKAISCTSEGGYAVVSREEAGLLHAFVGPRRDPLLRMAEELGALE